MKDCRKCGESKALDLFNRDASRPDGRHSYCRDCTVSMQRAAYVPSPRSVMTAEERKVARREASRRWREKNREYQQAYSRSTREKRNERNKEYRRQNPGWDTAQKRQYRAENRERTREIQRRSEELRRARKIGSVVAPFGTAELTARLAFFGFRCWMCGAPGKSLDHVKPLSKGGPHMLSNIRPACQPCNSRKHNKWPIDYPSVAVYSNSRTANIG